MLTEQGRHGDEQDKGEKLHVVCWSNVSGTQHALLTRCIWTEIADEDF